MFEKKRTEFKIPSLEERLKEITIIDNYSQLKEITDWIDENNIEILFVDTETTGLDVHTEELLSIQIGNSSKQFFITSLTTEMLKHPSLVKALTEYPLVFQNAAFDLKFLYKYRIVPKKEVHDTMLYEKILFTGYQTVPSSLKDLTDKYCGVDLDKEVRDNISRDTILSDEVVLYGCDDIRYLEMIFDKQMQQLEHKGLLEVARLEREYVKVIAYTSFCGMGFNVEAWKAIARLSVHQVKEITNKLNQYILDNDITEFIRREQTLFGDVEEVTINWNSNQQLLKLLHLIGINVESTDIKILHKHDNHPLVKLLVERSYYAKRASTYGEAFLDYVNPKTKRIHTNYFQILKTGRISSSNPNLQNIPSTEDLRKCFVPNKGNKLIVGDYSAQESRILAEFGNEKSMLEFYLSGKGDIHSFVASKLYPKELEGLDYKEIKESHSGLRSRAKGANFALAYGGNGATIARNLEVPISVGNDVERAYFKAFPDIKGYFVRKQKESYEQGYILADPVVNRKIYFDQIDLVRKIVNKEYIEDKAEASEAFKYKGIFDRRCLNYPIQSSAAGMIKMAAVELFNKIVEEDMFGIVAITAFVHDEIHLECPEEDAEYWQKAMKEIMERVADKYCPTIGVSVNPEIADYWVK